MMVAYCCLDCIIGPPESFPRYGDLQTAWASASARGTLEFLEFKYETPMHVIGMTEIWLTFESSNILSVLALDIYETYNPGCVVRICAHSGVEWVDIWTGQVEQQSLPERSRIFTPAFPITPFKSNWLRLHLDCTKYLPP